MNSAVDLISDTLRHIHFHHCMYGPRHTKFTRLTSNHAIFARLAITCDDQHEYEPLGQLEPGVWSTDLAVEYRAPLCKALVHAFTDLFFLCGAQGPPLSLVADDNVIATRLAQVAINHQPAGKKLRSLLPEYKLHLTLSQPHPANFLTALPTKLDHGLSIPDDVVSFPAAHVLPVGTRLLRVPFSGGLLKASTKNMAENNSEKPCLEVQLGIPWDPHEFLEQATMLGHPKHLANLISEPLAEAKDRTSTRSHHALATERTATMRKWILRATEL